MSKETDPIMFVEPLLLAVLRDAENKVLIVGHRKDGIVPVENGATLVLRKTGDGLTVTFPDGREGILPDTSHHDLLTASAVVVGVLEGASLAWQAQVTLDLGHLDAEGSPSCGGPS